MLPTVFAVLLGFIIIVYVVLDGFDLGLGILFPFTRSEAERDQLMNSVAPVWDGNETWLVFGGAVLYGAFPSAYGVILPLLYMPLMLMLIALVFRGVSFEFRFKADKSKPIWNWCFAIASIGAAFFQGVVLGTYIQGFDHQPVMWMTPFSFLTGIALTSGYALLGALWSIIKTGDALQKRMVSYAKGLLVLVSLFLIIISIWTPFLNNHLFLRWFSFPNMLYLAPLPCITAVTIVLTWSSLDRKEEVLPFFYAILIFICSYAGIGISLYPYIIPRQMTIWRAAAPTSTLIFLLWAVVLLIPVLLAYTAYTYRVFGGKTKHGYH